MVVMIRWDLSQALQQHIIAEFVCCQKKSVNLQRPVIETYAVQEQTMRIS